MQTVEWRPVKGFEGYYDVSNNGEIWSKRRHRTLLPTIDRYGYKKVVLSINGIPFHRTVHRLVAQAFIDNPYNLSTVIAKCCRNIRKTAGGYKWRYVNATD